MVKRTEFTRVSTKGQIVLPLSVRKSLKIEEGSVLAVAEAKKGLIVLKMVESPIRKEDLEELRPEFIRKLKKIEKEGKFVRVKDFAKRYGLK